MSSYTREQIDKMLEIPASVEYELKEILDGNLRKCGIFSRVFSRRKSSASLEHKFTKPEYQAGKKVQDIIGVRITLYFEDDIYICKKLIREWFRPVDDWEEYDNNISEFRASKINGIFELNGDWIRRIKPSTWELPIDQTFEIQIRTTFFEGWHEVEHDMRYKNKDIWEGYPAFSRKLNSVVATLELCDASMVSICEDFAHQLYLDKQWDAMIRMHFRLRMNDEPINSELEDILDNNSKSLGKRIFRCRREHLIEALMQEKRNDDSISINQIIMLVNEVDDEMHDESIADVAEKNSRFRGNRNKSGSEKNYQYSINPLEEYNNFFNRLTVESDEKDNDDLFDSLSQIIYSWTRDKFKAIFPLPIEEITNCNEKIPGYWLLIDCNSAKKDFLLQTYHLSTSEVGKIWSVYCHLYFDDNKEKFIFDTKSSILSTIPVSIEERIVNYNPPRFYSEILKNDDYIVKDITTLEKRCIPLKDNEAEKALDLIMNPERETPVVLVVSKVGADGFLDEKWLSRYWCSDLAERTGVYAHIYRCSKVVLTRILNVFGMDMKDYPGVYMFNTGCMTEKRMLNKDKFKSYSENYVKECVHNSVKVSSDRTDVKTKLGERAFLQEMVDAIRMDNIIKQG